MSFDIPPLEAAVPQTEVYHRRSGLAPRCKKMRLQGEADFCEGHFVNFGGQLSVSWLSARRPLPPMSAVVVPKKLHHVCHDVSKGSQCMQSWHSTRGCDEGTVRLATHARLASSRTPDSDIST